MPDQSSIAWYTKARNCARMGYATEGWSWVMKTTKRSSARSTQKAVLANPPQ